MLLLTGASVDATPILRDVDAVLWAGYAGQFGGEAVAAALAGHTNPSGRLPMTWYAQNFYEAWTAPALDPYTGAVNASSANASYFDASLLPNNATGSVLWP